jgi:hypothetical protein
VNKKWGRICRQDLSSGFIYMLGGFAPLRKTRWRYAHAHTSPIKRAARTWVLIAGRAGNGCQRSPMLQCPLLCFDFARSRRTRLAFERLGVAESAELAATLWPSPSGLRDVLAQHCNST